MNAAVHLAGRRLLYAEHLHARGNLATVAEDRLQPKPFARHQPRLRADAESTLAQVDDRAVECVVGFAGQHLLVDDDLVKRLRANRCREPEGEAAFDALDVPWGGEEFEAAIFAVT